MQVVCQEGDNMHMHYIVCSDYASFKRLLSTLFKLDLLSYVVESVERAICMYVTEERPPFGVFRLWDSTNKYIYLFVYNIYIRINNKNIFICAGSKHMHTY